MAADREAEVAAQAEVGELEQVRVEVAQERARVPEVAGEVRVQVRVGEDLVAGRELAGVEELGRAERGSRENG